MARLRDEVLNIVRWVGRLLHMSLDSSLLEILACPCDDHAPLRYDENAQTLTCTSCARVFQVKDGLPILLLDEAEKLGEKN